MLAPRMRAVVARLHSCPMMDRRSFMRQFKRGADLAMVAIVRIGLRMVQCFCGIIIVLWASSGWTQEQNNRAELVQNRALSQRLSKAEELIAAGDLGRGVELLQSVLDQPEDYQLDRPQGDVAGPLSLKQHVQTLLSDASAETLKAYELQYGHTARRLLDQANTTYDNQLLLEVCRRFFLTDAGHEAAYVLATQRMDAGHALSAAMWFERLRSSKSRKERWEPLLSFKTALCWELSGDRDTAAAVLIELGRTTADARITLGTKQLTLPQTSEQAHALLATWGNQPNTAGLARIPARSWLMPGGNATRTAISSPAAPVVAFDWKFQPLPANVKHEESPQSQFVRRLEALEQSYRDHDFLTVPAAAPLLMGNLAIVRSMRNVQAINVTTGALAWETAIQDLQLHDILKRLREAGHSRAGVSDHALQQFQARRAWRDLTSGSISADGNHVYAVVEFALQQDTINARRFAGQMPAVIELSNKLVAIDAQSGRLLWEVGGPRGDFPLPQAGAFFLGPPLPLNGQLYCLVESRGEIRLLVLAPETGQEEWSQLLTMTDDTVLLDQKRRLSGISPTYSDGILVCPTIAGSVVGLDLDRRMLLWEYRYLSNDQFPGPQVPDPFRRPIPPQMRQGSGGADDDGGRWLDSLPRIESGRVLITPRDSNEVHCLELADGSLSWKQNRGQGLYLATVDRDQAVIVGQHQVSAVHLQDGTPAWSQPAPIATPSGRGFATGNAYHIPLTSGEIGTIDLTNGRLLIRSQLPDGRVPGNLVSVNGTIVSQTANSVTGFEPVDRILVSIDEKLRQNPADATALAMRGEIRLHQGDLEAGLKDIRSAFAAEPTAGTRHVLVGALLEGLRIDFSKTHHATAAELDSLIEDSRQRSMYRKMYADGLRKMGERKLAFEEYLKLAGETADDLQMERLDGTLAVRSDRWIRARMAELYAASTAAERADLDHAIAVKLESLADDSTNDALSPFLSYFKGIPIPPDAYRKVVERLIDTKADIELELRLEQMRRSSDEDLAGYATAQLARSLINRDLATEAATLFDLLDSRWATATCLNGKTGHELVEEWRTDKRVKAAMTVREPWPEVSPDVQTRLKATGTVRTYSVPIKGSNGTLFENWALAADSRGPSVYATDAEGHVRWRLSADTVGSINPGLSGMSAYVYGRLMVVLLGDRFVVLDALSTKRVPPVLWTRSLFEPTPGTTQVMLPRLRVFADGRVIDPYGRLMGTVGVVSGEQIVYQQGTKLTAADLLTGEPLWVRNNVSRGSLVFGDNDYLFVESPQTNQAFILRASDGEQLGTKALPDVDQRIATHGRKILCWTKVPAGNRLQWIDVLSDQAEWSLQFDFGSAVTVLQEEIVAVMQPDGGFTVLDLHTGSAMFEATVEAVEQISRISLFASPDRYVLLIDTSESESDPASSVRVYPIPHDAGVSINGRAYGFDRHSGKALWSTSIEHQAIDVRQQSTLPILVFACRFLPRVMRNGQPGIGRAHMYSVLILDQRTGDVIYQDRRREPFYTLHIEPSPQKGMITVGLENIEIAIAYEDADRIKAADDGTPADDEESEAKDSEDDQPEDEEKSPDE